MKKNRIRVLTGILILFAMLCIGNLAAYAEEYNVPAGEFSFVDTNGNKISNDTLKGKTTVMIFSSSYCGNCNYLLDQLGEASWFGKENIPVIMGLFDVTTQEKALEYQSGHKEGIIVGYSTDKDGISGIAFYRLSTRSASSSVSSYRKWMLWQTLLTAAHITPT